MLKLRLTQRFGVGIATAKKALLENDNPPLEWDVKGGYWLLRMFKHP